VIGAVQFYVREGKFEDVDVFGNCGEAVKSAIEVVAIVEKVPPVPSARSAMTSSERLNVLR
jgi:hypothetical protein